MPPVCLWVPPSVGLSRKACKVRKASATVHSTPSLSLPPTSTAHRPPAHRGLCQVKELHEPLGWVRVPLFAPGAGGPAAIAADAAGGSEGPVLRAHFVQICVVAMHQNGRDTHIRQVGLRSFVCGAALGIMVHMWTGKLRGGGASIGSSHTQRHAC